MNTIHTPSKSIVATISEKGANAKSDVADGKTFGNVLAQQLSDNAPRATVMPEKSHGKLTSKNELVDIKADTPTTPSVADTANTVIALIQPMQEDRNPAIPAAVETVSNKTATSALDVKAGAADAKAGAADAKAGADVKAGAVDAELVALPTLADAKSTVLTDKASAKPEKPVLLTPQNEKTAAGLKIDSKALVHPAAQVSTTSNVAVKTMKLDSSATAHDPVALIAAASKEPVAQTIEQVVAAQMSGTAALQSHAPVNLPAMATPLGKHGWTDEFTQKISWMTNSQQDQFAELHLNPPDLGPLSVVLKVSENQATVMFSSPHLAVREAVENSLPKLREILAENGITLGNTSVNDQSQRDSNTNSQQGSQRDNRAWDNSPAQSVAMPSTVGVQSLRRHNGMVDTFA